MPLILLFLGLGGVLAAWGAVRQQRKQDEGKALALPPSLPHGELFPWQQTAAPVPAASRAFSLPSSVLSQSAVLSKKYDEGLTDPEVAAIIYARAQESDPKNLESFAASLAPDYPIAVARLRSQALQLRRIPYKQPTSTKVEMASSKLASRLSAIKFAGVGKMRVGEDAKYSTFFTLPGVAPAPSLESAKAKASPVEGVDFKLGDAAGWEAARVRLAQAIYDREMTAWLATYKPLYDVYMNTRIPVSRFSWGIGGPVADPAPTQMLLADALREAYYDAEAEKNKALEKKSLLASIVSIVSGAAGLFIDYMALGTKVVAPIVANVPVIGTAIAFVSTATMDFVKGEPIDDAMIDAVGSSLPGQPLSRVAYNAGVSAVRAISKGERFDKFALTAATDAAWDALPANVKEIGRPAFDGAVALAQGKDLQDAGFAMLKRLAAGNDWLEQGADFADKFAHAAQTGQDVRDVLVNSLIAKASAVSGFADKVAPVVDAMSKTPALAGLTPAQVSQEQGVEEPVAHAALASLRPLPIPEWLSKRLGLVGAAEIYYPDPAFIAEVERRKKIVALPTLAQTQPQKFSQIKQQLEDRKKWVDHYLQALGTEKGTG